jgi:putative membrane-bound dehydrogenase-like protein
VPGLDAFLIKPGFRIELAAGEALVNTPVAMAFDENKRLFVVEWPGMAASELRNRPGRIRLLEDTDGDGVFDSSTVYADNLPAPSGIACYDGGVFVTAGTEIVFLKDTRADGIADSRKVVFSGFGSGTAIRPPAEARLTSLVWGLDNRIHGGTAGLGGVISAPGGTAAEQVSLVDSDYAFDPRTGALMAEAGPSQAGVTFDSRGQRFVSDFARPLRKESYDLRYTARNPFFPNHEVLLPVASPATAVFHWAGTAAARPGGATSSGAAIRPREVSAPTNKWVAAWLTNAHGAVIYRGTAFPTEYQENLFIACPELGIVHRELLHDNGLDVTASRAAGEPMTEFLVGKEASFHPVQLISGPEGAMYVADVGPNAQGGHIYRITAAQFKAPKIPVLAKASTRDLVATLAHPDGWQRDTAARLLYQRRDPGAPYLLTNMLRNARLPLARLHALHALEGLDALTEGAVTQAFLDRDETVRQHAVRLCERFVVDGNLPDGIWTQLRSMTADPSIRVRYQLAFTLGEIKRPGRAPAFMELLTQDLGNQRMQTAVLSSLATGAAELLALAGADARLWNETLTQSFPEQLAGMIGLAGDLSEQQQTLDYLDRTALEQQQSFRLLFAFGDGLRRARKSLAGVDQGDRLQRFHALARVANLSGGGADSTRAAAIRFRGVSPYATLGTDDFLAVLIAGQSEAVQAAALEALAHYDNPALPTRLAERWQDLAPPLRNRALAICIARDNNLPALLTEIENGRIGIRELDSTQINFLRMHPDPAIRERVGRDLGSSEAERAGLYARFQPALRPGLATRGQPLFAARCAKCHQIGGNGQGLGPDLAAARIRGKEQLLNAILFPGSDIEPGYTTQVITVASGENLLGTKVNETAASVTIRQPNGVEFVLARAGVAGIQPQPWSLMPDNLEQDLTPGQMADLLEYLMTGGR